MTKYTTFVHNSEQFTRGKTKKPTETAGF